VDKKDRYNTLSWKILEAKYRYYILSEPTITDYEYDLMEKEYDSLADELGLPKTASDMVDFKSDRPSCQAVIEKVRLQGLYKSHN
jgi:NAD-dependent DNA ligase